VPAKQVCLFPSQLRSYILTHFVNLYTADIIRDFQSKVLQEEWNKFGNSVLIRRNERLQRLQERGAELQHQRHIAAVARQHRMASIETAIDQMQANIADQIVAIDYDATKLMKKFGHWMTIEVDDPDRDSKPLPCLGQRAHWIDCQKKYAADSRPCNFYVAALEECVQRTIFGASASSTSAQPNDTQAVDGSPPA
jgi:hypothetical protein